MSATAAIVGIGEMGGPMAGRLLDAGITLHGYNRTKAKADTYCERGMHWADSPRAAAQAADVVLTMVSNDAALEAVASGDDGILAGLRPGKTWVELSTTSPEGIRDLEKRVRETGAELIDGAILGSSVTVENGQALVLLGGDPASCERLTVLLKPFGNVKRVGDAGHAKVMKIALNLNLPVQVLALSEGMLLAEKSGIDRQTALDVMLGGVVASPMLKYRAPFIMEMPQRPRFDVTMMQKDVTLALDLGRELQVPLPTTAAADEMLTVANAQGLSRYDFAAIFHALARIAGIDASPNEV